MKAFLILFLGFSVTSATETLTVKDPVADFLNLPIGDRYSEASEVVRVDKVIIDLDLDGQPEVLVGHHKMWAGDNNGVYYAIYKVKSLGEYERLTKPNQDVRLLFHDGSEKFIFVGRIDELDATGLLIFNYPHRDAALSAQRIESRQFLTISEGALKIIDLPGLDLKNPSDNVLFEKYSGQIGKQGGYSCESLTSDKLKQLGYSLPDWTKLPAATESSAVGDHQKSSNQGVNTSDLGSVKAETPSDKRRVRVTADKPSALWLWIVVAIATILGAWTIFKRRS